MNSPGFEAFDDLGLALSIRHSVAQLRQSAAPTVRPIFVAPGTTAPGCRMAVFAGSFNPLTIAHEAIIEQALGTVQCDEAVVSIAVHTIDKTEQQGASLVDRLVSLTNLARAHQRVSVAVTNLGLYLDQAIAYRKAFPKLGGLIFLVGFDKIVQILDPRYYQDRDRELGQLFRLARFMVAPRGDNDRSDLDLLLQFTTQSVIFRNGWMAAPRQRFHSTVVQRAQERCRSRSPSSTGCRATPPRRYQPAPTRTRPWTNGVTGLGKR